MHSYLTRTCLGLALALAGATSLAAEDFRDHVILTNGQLMAVYVERETAETLYFRYSQGGGVVNKAMNQVRSIVYHGMVADGYYKKAKESQARGNYDDAADNFSQLAAGGKPGSWQEVYGDMGAGDCLELAKHYDAAAESFAKVVSQAPATKDDRAVPRPRLWIDACYREGVALAEAGKIQDAAKLADGLDTYSKLTNSVDSSGASSRASAIRAAVAAQAKDKDTLQDASGRVLLTSQDDPDVWFHWNIFLAGAYRSLGMISDATHVLDTMADDVYLVHNPSRLAEVVVLRGSCLIATDPQAALVDLITIDVLPYGSEDERCECRAQAGKLMLAQADKLKSDTHETAVAFRHELLSTARLLLAAAASSTSTSSFKAEAKAALDALGPEEGTTEAAAKTVPAGAAPAPAPPAAHGGGSKMPDDSGP